MCFGLVRWIGSFLLAFASITSAAEPMKLGTNFWNLGWHKSSDCFNDWKNVTGDNPWNPQFLKDIRIFKVLRFMDWDITNGSPRERWGERKRKEVPRQNPVAYEWMIDLCNRNDADMWVTVPHRMVNRASGDRASDYAVRLCTLVKTGVDMGEVDLAPMVERLHRMTAAELVAAGGVKTCEPLEEGLKLYVEYSNETWNGAFKQAHYCCDEGAALGLDDNRWTAGFRFHAWAAIRVFRGADVAFGEGSRRVVRVLATQSANNWIAGQHLQVMKDEKLNPWKVKADAIAIAPYFGHGVDGAAGDVVERLREGIAKAVTDCEKHRKIAEAAGVRLIAYEGGQHVTRNAAEVNRGAEMYELYEEYLKGVAPHVDLFCHYAHVGQAGKGGAWGAMEYTGQAPEDAHKYRAMLEWVGRQGIKVRSD
jgi:hypothetical protein